MATTIPAPAQTTVRAPAHPTYPAALDPHRDAVLWAEKAYIAKRVAAAHASARKLARAGVRVKIGEVRQVAVMVYGAEGGGFPVAIAVRGLHCDRATLRALGSIDASWPEHYHWALRALDRGDVWAASDGTVWFFEGKAGEELAGL